MTQPSAPLAPSEKGAEQSVEQLRYARWLEAGSRLGLLLLVLSFAGYGSGLLAADVPLQRLPELWSLPVGQYLAQTQAPTGWGWLARLGRGEGASMAGIAVLAACSLPCLLALLPLYLRRGDRAYVLLCLAEVAVIMLAASGWLTGGHG
jgi:hypothetical protein